MREKVLQDYFRTTFFSEVIIMSCTSKRIAENKNLHPQMKATRGTQHVDKTIIMVNYMPRALEECAVSTQFIN